MNYDETINYLFSSLPMYQKVGQGAYKPGLQNIEEIDNICGNPHKKFKTIHVAGSNGKGSVSHTLAAILQLAGYRVGLYTSPHMVDFRERIRVNGEMITEEYVVEFTNNNLERVKDISPSFFEWSTEMAFSYFADCNVDIAVIECGLGGRLDSTNIISPILSIITNISIDHTNLLGDTLPEIAYEKGGIIKPNTPVVIGEYLPETKSVFIDKAKAVNADIVFAEDEELISSYKINLTEYSIYNSVEFGEIYGGLSGACQLKNAATIIKSLSVLKSIGIDIPNHAVLKGFKDVASLTSLMGRWQIINSNPTVICDTGHNKGAFTYIVNQLKGIKDSGKNIRIVLGMVNDKDVSGVISMLPKDATYYFTRASISRALSTHEIAEIGSGFGLTGDEYPTVYDAYTAAISDSCDNDIIFVGGSTFVVADLLAAI